MLTLLFWKNTFFFLRKDFIVNTKLYKHNVIKREGWKNIGKHGRDIKWVAPASDAAWRTRDAIALTFGRVRPLFFFFFFSRLAPTQLKLGPIWVISSEISRFQNGWFRTKFKKKKKKVQNALFELNNIPYFSSSAHFIQTPSSLTLSHSITHLSLSLCSRLSTFVSALRLPCDYETLSQTATQSLQTPKFNSLSILWVVFNLWTSCFSYYLLLLLNLVYVYIMWKSMLSNILKI